MNEQSNPSAPVILPAKRRRGRPRKDGGVAKRGTCLSPTTPAPEPAKKIPAVEANHQVDSAVESMVGRMVSGVIDGCFDAGYFLTVRVGNSNTLLRGVIFQPGRFAPISASNDIAPQAKMYQRQDIPVPVPGLQESDKRTMDTQQEVLPPNKPNTNDTFVLNNQMNHQMVPQSGPFSSGSSFPFGGKIMVHQNPDQRLQIQSQSGHQTENLAMVEHDEVMQVFELSNQSEVPNKVISSAPDKSDIMPSEGTSNHLSHTQNQALGSMGQPCFAAYNLEQSNPRIPQNPAAATVSQTVDLESQDVESKMEKNQFDDNHEHETPVDSVQEKTSTMDSVPFVVNNSEGDELHQTHVVEELQFISQEPEAPESEVKLNDTDPKNEIKSPVQPVQDHTIEKLGTTQMPPQALEFEHGGPHFERHHDTQTVHRELINDSDFMMEKPTSPKNNNGAQHSHEGKPIRDTSILSGRSDNPGPQFSLESTSQILTLGIGGSDNPGRFQQTQFYNPASATTTDFGFVLGDFVQSSGSHGNNPNNIPESHQHR